MIRRRTLKALAPVLLAAAILHFASYDFLNQPVITDLSFFLYFAARTAEGAVPYLDFLDYKTPLAIFAGAFAYASGTFTNLDGLHAVRFFYLLFAAFTATATGLVLFYLANRRQAAAWAGVMLYCGLNLLGLMPCIGNMPKQLAMLCALAALILARRGAWILAGAAAVLAGLDWQPGGALACLAVIAVAMLSRGRVRAFVRSGLGMALTAAVPLVYFTLHGALGKALHMVFLAPLARPGAEGRTFDGRLERIWRLLHSDCQGEMWIIYLALAGLVLYPLVLVLLRRRGAFPLAAGAAVYHYGILAWTLHDFQSHGDLFILLGSAVFFAAITVCGLYYWIVWLLAGRGRYRARRMVRVAVGLVFVLGLAAAARPSFRHSEGRSGAPAGPVAFTLADQREVARQFAETAGGHNVACLDFQEILLLASIKDTLGFVYYDPVIHGLLKEGREDMVATLIRRLEEADPGLIIMPQRSRRAWISKGRMMRWLRRQYKPRRFDSKNGEYGLMVWCKAELELPGGR